MSLTLGQIVDALGGALRGAAKTLEIQRIAPLESAEADAISFLSNPKYLHQLAASQAACVVVAPAQQDAAVARGACIVVDNPYLYFAQLTQLWKRMHAEAGVQGVHSTAVVHPQAKVHPSATIGPLCVVERGAEIGADTVLKSRVTISEYCVVGERCLLHPGVVIGADGFGFAQQQGQWVKIEQLGRVRIGSDVEIGANTCIDRGALDDTVIADGVKLDNLVQIGHNVQVGAHTAIAGNAGVAGSAQIGAHCSIGGASNILGHLTIGDGVAISPTSVVMRSVTQPGLYTGIFPLAANAQWEKNAATLKQLHALRERIKALEKALDAQRSPNGN
ncbi:UDP-3-O-(3-hydroxymyristoyl)glucosamine N-acyltransferase [Comamonas sp. GB3 AK4-5]|uniref:UDP-3-O-(3-hydroxymyristoyl)glucosamine N-acyltransferase n=1 Tax=Comamonas sp. GB3 AK4-5 TaxID=3231487 RepID=UPI00351DABD4